MNDGYGLVDETKVQTLTGWGGFASAGSVMVAARPLVVGPRSDGRALAYPRALWNAQIALRNRWSPLVPALTRGPGRSSTVTATPWRSRNLSGLRPLTPPPQPRQPRRSQSEVLANRDRARKPL
jgi:hypothetical protein